jgi:Uncharacterized conserved protein
MFRTFPTFTKLTLADREEYESYIKDFPPISDIAFPSLMIWWNSLGGLKVSRLNGNLVISYWLPGDEELSGLSLVGTRNIDESICTIFDYLSENNELPRLVNIPDFVVQNIRYPELFRFRVAGSADEYLLSLHKFASIDAMPQLMRMRARRFLKDFDGLGVEIKPLNLHSARIRQLLLDSTAAWPLKGINNINKLEREALPGAVAYAPMLGLQGVGLYIAEVLQGFCLYFPTNDKDHAIISHARVNYELPRIFDYVVHTFARHLTSEGFKYLNIHGDNGSQKMRVLKLALKPAGFFRKYTIEPATAPVKRRYGLFTEP